MSAKVTKGVFITFEGGEGVGKSTQALRLATHLEAMGRQVVLLHEPGSTIIGEKIRTVLLDRSNADMAPRAELLLYEAARAQIVSEKIRPALEAGHVVVCDRFTDSTLAYQGYARGMDLDTIEKLNRIACDGLMPDRTVLIARDASIGLVHARRAGADRLESEDIGFHERVHEGFRRLAAADGGARIVVVPLQEDKDLTEQAIFHACEDLFS